MYISALLLAMEQIFVFGASGHAKHVCDIIEKENLFTIAGIIDFNLSKNDLFYQYRILGNDDDLPKLIEDTGIKKGIVAVGDNWRRKVIAENILKLIPKFEFIASIHPSAQIGNNVKIGNGSVIMPGVIIAVDSIIGEHCIINTKSSVDHDCIVGNYVSILPGATLGGNVKIGNNTAIGLGANVIHNKNIGENTVVGAGSLVITDLPSNILAYGVPAKIMRTRIEGEKYL